MKLSVIVCVYNGEAYLRECLDSILGSSLRDIELVCVNDASTDSTADILADFAGRDPRVRVVVHDVNKGLFQARLTGMKAAAGDWIGFVDADDMVSEDRFRQLVAVGERESVGVVWGPVVQQFGADRMTQDLTGPQFDRRMSRTEHLKCLFATCGRDWTWHVFWGKIFRRDLAQRVAASLADVAERIGQCEDVLFSTALACEAESVYFLPSAEPYIYRRTDNCMTSARAASPEKLRDMAHSLKAVLAHTNEVLKPHDANGRLASNLAEWIGHYAKLWHGCTLPDLADIRKDFESLFCTRQSMHESLCAPKMRPYLGDPLRPFKDRIADPSVKVVSFDVFDTLVVRPFWQPIALFAVVWEKFRKRRGCEFEIDFVRLRTEAESVARQRSGAADVTLDFIYETLADIASWEKLFADDIKEEEIRCEIQFCRARRTALDLVGYARNLGKRVVAISDMYLPSKVIGQILEKEGFGIAVDDVFVSCEMGRGKWDGALFPLVAERLGAAPGAILHIGDNFRSDVEMARKAGLKALHLPRPVDQMRSSIGADGRTLGRIFSRKTGFIDGFEARLFLGIRCRLALAANFLYDNPFAHQARSGAFGGDVVVFGYFALGMHLLAVADWIDDEVRERRLTGIHFLMRDGHLPRLAYERIHGGNVPAPCDSWHLNRGLAIALMLKERSDFLSWLEGRNVGWPFDSLFTVFKAVLGDGSYAQAKDLLRARFGAARTIDECGRRQVVSFCRDEVFPKCRDEIAASQKAVVGYLKGKTFGDNDATFDIGYSCRVESALARYGVHLTPLYMHLTAGEGLVRSRRYGLNAATFYDYKQSVTGVVRELMFSSVEPKCVRYGDVGGVFGPVFEAQTHVDYFGGQVIREIQAAALAYVDDWTATFGRGCDCLAARRTDASLPYDFFLTWSEPSDHEFLSTFRFDDGQGGEDDLPKAFWDRTVRSCVVHCQAWRREPLTVGRMKGFAVRRVRRLTSVVRRGVWAALRHPAKAPRWCLPYWFLRRREGDVYANAFTRLPSKLRSVIPAGFMRLWSEHVASSSERE